MERETDRQTDRQTETERHTERQKETQSCLCVNACMCVFMLIWQGKTGTVKITFFRLTGTGKQTNKSTAILSLSLSVDQNFFS